jgi:DNA invertase Pin-like site-specific DNA recombinase
MTTAAIYTRISKDEAGDCLGTDRQERLCRDLAARHGLEVAHVLTDDDVSAYKQKRRPGFEALVEMLKAGEVGAVCVYHVDRLYRRMADIERLVLIVEATGAEIYTAASGDIDLATASGRMVARIVGAAAQHESERIGERGRMKHDELAAKGAAPGGRAPYGYRWQAVIAAGGAVERTYVVDDTEAEAVRTIARRVLEGASLLAISRELDAAGVTTREGRPWHHATVRAVVINPAVAGLRVHRRQVAGPGTWEPVLDRSVWEEVRATLTDPARKRTRPARKHLLAGLVENPAGERMNGSVDKSDRAVYTTRVPARQSLQVGAVALEELVVGAVLTTFDKTALPAPDTGHSAVSAGEEVARLEVELGELADLRGRGEITLAEWLAARKPLQGRIDVARKTAGATRRRITSRVAQSLTKPGALRRAWPSLTFDEQREILALVVEAVVVGPATRARWTPIEERVTVRWRA